MAGIIRGIVIDQHGSPVAGATVTITDHVTGALIDLYADILLTTPTANPLTASQRGKWSAYVANGRYDVKAESGRFEDFDAYFRVLEPDTTSQVFTKGDRLPVFTKGDRLAIRIKA